MDASELLSHIESTIINSFEELKLCEMETIEITFKRSTINLFNKSSESHNIAGTDKIEFYTTNDTKEVPFHSFSENVIAPIIEYIHSQWINFPETNEKEPKSVQLRLSGILPNSSQKQHDVGVIDVQLQTHTISQAVQDVVRSLYEQSYLPSANVKPKKLTILQSPNKKEPPYEIYFSGQTNKPHYLEPDVHSAEEYHQMYPSRNELPDMYSAHKIHFSDTIPETVQYTLKHLGRYIQKHEEQTYPSQLTFTLDKLECGSESNLVAVYTLTKSL